MPLRLFVKVHKRERCKKVYFLPCHKIAPVPKTNHDGGLLMEKPVIRKENVVEILDKKFIRVYDLQYAPGRHYYDATRRPLEDLVALKDAAAHKAMLPDAVSCIVIIAPEGEEPKLLLQDEYRYPAGQLLLSIPAGLIDAEDKKKPREEAIIATAIRELKEETGITMTEKDRASVANPFLFSTPGMTDESNALACLVIRSFDRNELSHAGSEGGEFFADSYLLTRADALRIMRQGCDDKGIFYSIFTWAAMNYFVADLWK